MEIELWVWIQNTPARNTRNNTSFHHVSQTGHFCKLSTHSSRSHMSRLNKFETPLRWRGWRLPWLPASRRHHAFKDNAGMEVKHLALKCCPNIKSNLQNLMKGQALAAPSSPPAAPDLWKTARCLNYASEEQQAVQQ